MINNNKLPTHTSQYLGNKKDHWNIGASILFVLGEVFVGLFLGVNAEEATSNLDSINNC